MSKESQARVARLEAQARIVRALFDAELLPDVAFPSEHFEGSRFPESNTTFPLDHADAGVGALKVESRTLAASLVDALLGRRTEHRSTARTGSVRVFVQEAVEDVRKLYGRLSAMFPPMEVAGAGVPVGESAPRRVNEAFTFFDRVSVDLTLEWSSKSLTVTASTDPVVTEQVLVFLERVSDDKLLAVVALPSGQARVEQTALTEELGFDLTTVPWKFRAVLA